MHVLDRVIQCKRGRRWGGEVQIILGESIN